MTTAHKRFILNKLCPFLLREQGRGFEMYRWLHKETTGTYFHFDTNRRVRTPTCGTVCCIGGSIQHLKRTLGGSYFETVGRLIGLNMAQSDILFSSDIRWPQPFAQRYMDAKTPYQQAKVAVALLKKVVSTEGACLDSV